MEEERSQKVDHPSSCKHFLFSLHQKGRVSDRAVNTSNSGSGGPEFNIKPHPLRGCCKQGTLLHIVPRHPGPGCSKKG